MKVVKQNCML